MKMKHLVALLTSMGLIVGSLLALKVLINSRAYFQSAVGEGPADDPCLAAKAGPQITEYYPGGKIRSERTCKNRRSNGLAREYYADGTLRLEETYLNGKRQGISQQYYPGGGLDRVVNYKAGRIDGIFKKYNPNGKVAYETVWKNDRQTDELFREYKYYKNNNLKSEFLLERPLRSTQNKAIYREFFEDGKIRREYVSPVRGRIASFKEYDESGQLVSEQKDGFTGSRKFFYDNGRLEKEERYEKGELVEAADYSPDGLVQLRLKAGLLESYDHNGKVIEKKNVQGWNVEKIAQEYAHREMDYAPQ